MVYRAGLRYTAAVGQRCLDSSKFLTYFTIVFCIEKSNTRTSVFSHALTLEYTHI